ncbi:hypothetical protein GGS23DRAFT_357446 [Durotheca rogersii]|uniref:uncharacterized protein n=1 Tax=Durotheca rogersii TaxID=419775 RepID=UPI002220F724|nr:uncharacterized protein GGS23DRAFT_357446 [Durotheca rogersii]KAI5865862.1 hypothetical protein GGS23DRAFT_357446 [Durotheca rogersii]
MESQATQKPADIHDLEAKFQRLSFANLGEGPHRDILTRAIRNVLSTDIAEITLAQIVDGLPLSEVERDAYTGSGYLCGDHPLHKTHKQLCPGALEKARQLYADFDVDSLQISSKLLHEYKISSPGSRAFQTRLIELAAVSIHQIAVQLYKLGTSFHKDDGIATWEPQKDHFLFWHYNPDGAPPTLFQHRQYRYYDQYPDGVADGVGYWAESRIFGGVVLFDRREPGSADDVDPEAVYLHPERKFSTYRIYRLLDSQKRKLSQFLLSEAPLPGTSPLPIFGDKNNRWRVDPEEPVETTGIYRDLWERKPLGKDDPDLRLRDVIDTIDYPAEDDLRQAQERAAIRRERNWLEECNRQ